MLSNVLFTYIGWLLAMSVMDINPTATLLSENGGTPDEETTLMQGDTYTGSAPLEFRFTADETETYSYRYEWNFARDASFSDIFLTRYDYETIYSFQEAGTFYVRVIITDMETEETNTSDAFVIQISESELEVPNAFSPNGDGVNDIYKVKYESLVSFEAYIFNRWGQQLYHWSLQNIDEGWDGTAHGKEVPEGVYFIVVRARGADGIEYEEKKDINILR